jgi:hypothetical protein
MHYLVRGFVCEYSVIKIRFHYEILLAPHPTPKLEDPSLSAVRDFLFNILAATFHIGGRSSIRKLKTRHTMMTRTHLGVDGWIILRRIFRKWDVRVWTELSGLRIETGGRDF